MGDLSIPLSDHQKAFVDEQVAAGAYASAADYVVALIDVAFGAHGPDLAKDLLDLAPDPTDKR